MSLAWWARPASLAGLKDRWKGTLVFIGQPAEEVGAGAKAMLEAGLLQRFPRPDFALALHCDGRYPAGHVNYREGQMQANVDSVDIIVKGKGGHGAAPHTTIDPIVIAARIVLDLQTIVSRERNPLEPAVVTVGAIHGGTKHNIIPDEVKMQLTVRTMNDIARKEVLESIARIARAAALGAKAPEPLIQHRAESFTPALFNEKELTQKMVHLFKDVLGPERVHERPMSMGGEDFSQFTPRRPAYFLLAPRHSRAGGLRGVAKAGRQGTGKHAFAVLRAGSRADAAHWCPDDEHGDPGVGK